MTGVDGGPVPGPSPSGSDYPFLQPSPDVRGLLVDFWLSHAASDARLPLRVARLVGFGEPVGSSSSAVSESVGGVNPVQVLVLDAADRVAFDSERATYSGRAFSSRFYVHEWRAADAVCRVVQYTGPADRVWPHVLEPARAVLDERAHEVRSGGVTALVVGAARLTGPVELEAGYNAVLESRTVATLTTGVVATRTRRARAPVRLSLAPGGGLGVFPGCVGADPVVRRINGQAPDATGNFRLAADGCVRVERPPDDPAELRLTDDCEPCCDCADYVNAYRGLTQVYDRLKAVGDETTAARDLFAANRDRWLAAKTCKEAQVLRLSLVSAAPATVVVVAAFGNHAAACRGLRLTLTATRPGGAGVFTSGGTFAVDAATGEWANATVTGPPAAGSYTWDAVDPGRAVRLRTTVRFPTDPTCAVPVTVTVRGYVVATGELLQTLTKSIIPVCTADGSMVVV